MTRQQLISLDEIIHEINQDLPPLKEFVLPGGSQLGAKAHVSRTVCRRTERSLVNLIENNPNMKIIEEAEYYHISTDYLIFFSF